MPKVHNITLDSFIISDMNRNRHKQESFYAEGDFEVGDTVRLFGIDENGNFITFIPEDSEFRVLEIDREKRWYSIPGCVLLKIERIYDD